jgi:hypothetical protein
MGDFGYQLSSDEHRARSPAASATGCSPFRRPYERDMLPRVARL